MFVNTWVCFPYWWVRSFVPSFLPSFFPHCSLVSVQLIWFWWLWLSIISCQLTAQNSPVGAFKDAQRSESPWMNLWDSRIHLHMMSRCAAESFMLLKFSRAFSHMLWPSSVGGVFSVMKQKQQVVSHHVTTLSPWQLKEGHVVLLKTLEKQFYLFLLKHFF